LTCSCRGSSGRSQRFRNGKHGTTRSPKTEWRARQNRQIRQRSAQAVSLPRQIRRIEHALEAMVSSAESHHFEWSTELCAAPATGLKENQESYVCLPNEVQGQLFHHISYPRLVMPICIVLFFDIHTK
jgi:hypothetical protein